jgi:hypothetical protein
MEIWESCPTFCYSGQGKNPIQTAPEFNFLSILQSVKSTVFSNSVVIHKS